MLPFRPGSISRRTSIGAIGGGLLLLNAPGKLVAQEQTIKIGALYPLSGPSAAIGNENMRGFQYVMDLAGNSVAGKKIETLFVDDQNSPTVALNEARRLVETEKVVALTGNLNSPIALAISAYALRMKIPYLAGPIATDLTASKGNAFTFRASNAANQLEGPYAQLLKRRGFKRGILMGSDYVAGHEVVDGIADALKSSGGTVVKEVFPRLGESDYAPYFADLGSQNADFAFGFFFGGDTLRFVRQYRAAGLKFPLAVTAAAISEGGVAQQLGADVDGVYSQETWINVLTDPISKAFIDGYQAKYKDMPGPLAVLGYHEATIILETLRALKGNVPDGTAMANAMQNVRFKSPGGQDFRFEPNHNPLFSAWLVQWHWKDGKATPTVIDTIRNIKQPAS
jgi:branched-chain amino acid transport system substrate-binding protein